MGKMFKYIFLMTAVLLFCCSAGAQDTIFEEPPVIVQPPAEMPFDSVYESVNNATDYYQFKEGITPSRVDARKIPDDELTSVRSDDAYWYVNEAPDRKKEKPKDEPKKRRTVFNEKWFKTLSWILLIGGFVALLIWFLATGNISLFKKRPQTQADGNTVEEQSENIFEMNFEKEIEKAVNARDFRMAVRFMYLRTLRDLSLRNLINYTHEKTNSDYLFQLAGSPYYKNFFRLTRNFDYTWYGQFPLTSERFSLVQADFNNFKQQLS
jgi:hypothetical protein